MKKPIHQTEDWFKETLVQISVQNQNGVFGLRSSTLKIKNDIYEVAEFASRRGYIMRKLSREHDYRKFEIQSLENYIKLLVKLCDISLEDLYQVFRVNIENLLDQQQLVQSLPFLSEIGLTYEDVWRYIRLSVGFENGFDKDTLPRRAFNVSNTNISTKDDRQALKDLVSQSLNEYEKLYSNATYKHLQELKSIVKEYYNDPR